MCVYVTAVWNLMEEKWITSAVVIMCSSNRMKCFPLGQHIRQKIAPQIDTKSSNHIYSDSIHKYTHRKTLQLSEQQQQQQQKDLRTMTKRFTFIVRVCLDNWFFPSVYKITLFLTSLDNTYINNKLAPCTYEMWFNTHINHTINWCKRISFLFFFL